MERVENTEGRTYKHHIKRYEFATGFVADKEVCSLACGTGYGEHYMTVQGKPKHMVGIDINAEAIEYAKSHYQHPLLTFEKSDSLTKNHPDNSFDLFVSFETIEHVEDDHSFLVELKRVLRPGGTLILSTPNKAFSFSNLFSKKPLNPFHIREYQKDELIALVSKYFKDVKLYGQKRILKRSIPTLWRYIYYKLSGKLGALEPDNFEIIEYPSDKRYSLAYFLIVCKK